MFRNANFILRKIPGQIYIQGVIIIVFFFFYYCLFIYLLIYFLLLINIAYLLLVALGLCCFAWACRLSLVEATGGYSLSEVSLILESRL